MEHDRGIAYFSMAIGPGPGMPPCSGGLGMLAGDSIRSAADMKIPMVGVSLLHRRGYFVQKLDETGHQREEPSEWKPEDFLVGVAGRTVPVYLLDADREENAPEDRELTGTLYGGDSRYRLCQEVLLGIGG